MRTEWVVKAVLVVGLIVAPMSTATPEASSLARLFGRSAARAAAKKVMPRMTRALAKDLVNHRTAPVKTLTAPRTVFRYATRSVARKDVASGLAPYRHMTSRGGPGRPLSAANAAKRYGLPRRPDVRETIRLGRGQTVILNKAQGGRPGVGEAVSPRPIGRGAIERVVSLH